ncbi:MAG: ABC transporter ATP-binding protein [Deltaproteobacteria bacterium]|nr:ABC transporter ATP-binding protein [Deltaproteobacteria bacterium]
MTERSHHPIIVAKGLTRIYQPGGNEVIGINNVDLEISSGELIALKGNSGSGKSTLLALLAGLDTPSRGTLIVANNDLQQLTPVQLTQYRRKVVGMVFQTFNLLPTLTVLENVSLPALLAGHPYARVTNKAMELLGWLNLNSRIHHLPSQLSGGEMQRTAIARALINEPAIILADEPTGNLDTRNGEIVIELLAELNRRFGRTVIIATHSKIADPHATLRICLKDGSITDTICCAP